MNEFAERLKYYIETSKTIAIGAHVNADGDAIGSVMAMAALIEKSGKMPKVFLYYRGDRFDHILRRELFFTDNPKELFPDIFIALDCGDKYRLGDAAAAFDNAKVTFNIDHHISNPGYGSYNLVAPAASSSCELVYETISRITEIDKYMAECIYTGLVTDTCAFKHSQTSPRTMEIAGKLMSLGIDFSAIQARVLHSHDFAAAKVFAAAVLKAKLEDGICYSALTLKEIRSYGAIFEQLDGISEYLLNTKGAKVSVFLYERGNKTIKCSFRSAGVDVNKVAAHFGGGGHVCAAGCTIEGAELSEATEACIAILKEALKNE